ncbi:hypothetical protein MHY85_05260 [Cellulomonas sp. ACRRI]|uniref:hypothetical protein n=1 Tax=Cellulomonas sp. ACRRI TaxID=2918188 RepID=UPI001EF353DC|nr:hypothetical protein [Cellulomonas sp. ACRRI]MCG7285384.1 hypothetical protein [Cellulomonas sp. ACRRI]
MTAPNHGTRARYNTPHSCRCDACKVAGRRYRKRRFLDLELGTTRLVDAGPVRAHLEAAKAMGVAVKEMAAAAGVTRSVAQEVYVGQPRVDATAAARILAVDPNVVRRRGRCMVDSTGSVRRVRALASLGWTGKDMSSGLRVSRATITRLLHGADEINAATRDAVTAGYRRMLTRQPPAATARQREDSARARNVARRNGWAGPLAWDDIDHDEAPVDVAPYRPAPKPMRALELAEMGLGNAEIAVRLGVSAYTVRDYLRWRVAA